MSISYALMSLEYIELAWKFHVSSDSCDDPTYYENYLRLCAMSDQKAGMGVTHLFVEQDEVGKAKAIVGFITLRATSLVSTGDDGKSIVHPSLEIAELAVSRDYERKGFGRDLVNIAFISADHLRKHTIGIKYIAVCAAKKAEGFYEKLGFAKIGSWYETPRDGWNNTCEAMYITLEE